ncbi:AAA family ATPase [uncultured Flavobacterium sp.]|uniref:AAA family ATPase n=1 Tax=uncultured Flavobacterium sp. TaxID=165435 RepID=UPI0026170D11|nr:AAA family ATPase [uncultured Flavobacterium sp.]
MDWQDYKVRNVNIEGARAAFERDCGTLFNVIYKDRNVKTVKISVGDGGIDVFIGNIGVEPISVIQCKFFLEDFGSSQKQQIKDSFNTVINSGEFVTEKWILCIPRTLDLKQNKWWCEWVDSMKSKHNLKDDFIILKDGNDLIDLFKTHNLYNQVFKIEDSLKIADIDKKVEDIHKTITNNISLDESQIEINKANFYLENVPTLFGENTDTHIERSETDAIYNWINNDLTSEQKNIFILEGEKGYGKTVVLKDLLLKLKQNNTNVLGIKADKYYASDRIELEKKIFQKENISIEKIVQLYKNENKALVIVIDQLDALSQTLSTNREFIQTYNRLIYDLSFYSNVRVVISTRSYDLNYDAELRIYKSNEYSKIKITGISKEKVQEVLLKYGINDCSDKFLELLAIPNHLDIFCRLPSKINIDTLSSLKDLYDALWKQLIYSKSELQLKSVLYKIADGMYQNQQITISNIFENQYSKEINYLKSNHLLIENNNELQFFHQTFYDYTFSRQFVENKKSLSNYINENKQSLYVRSIIKMVTEYYREYNHDEYCKTITQLITSSKFRFHIKTLVITSLGDVKNPTNKEKNIVSKFILTDFDLTRLFINSIFSLGWLKFIVNQNIPLKYFDYQKDWKINFYEKLVLNKIIKQGLSLKYDYLKQKEMRLALLFRLFINNRKDGLDVILNVIEKLPESDEKINFINRFLINVDDWSFEKLLVLFDKYFHFNIEDKNRDNFWYYKILEKIFNYYPNFVFDKLKPIILKCFEEHSFTINFTNEQSSLIEKINNINPDLCFFYFHSIFDEIVDNNKYEKGGDIEDSPLYKNSKFSELFESDIKENADDIIENLLIKYIKSKSKHKLFFKNYYEKHKDSNSISHLKILILGLTEIPLLYKEEVFEFIKIIHSKNGFNGYDDKFQLYLRELISKSFSIFSESQKLELANIILSIKHPADIYYYNDSNNIRKPALGFYGKKKYLFINSLPKTEMESIPVLKRTHQELFRKFGKLNVKQLDRSNISSGVVGPPLELSAYKKMTLIDWKKSFLMFNDYYERDRFNDSFKGGKREHSNSFREEVTNDPIKFYPLVKDLFDIQNISIDYISSGIDGLIKGKFDARLVKELYLKLIKLNLDLSNTLSSIWNVSYFIEEKVIDNEILGYLSNLALNHPHPEKSNNPTDPHFDSLNSVRGAAIHRIIHCYYNIQFSDTIFTTVENACDDKQTSVKVAILLNLAYLNYLDIDRAFKIFIKLTDTKDALILKYCFKSASYFNKKFYLNMLPLMDKVIDNEELHDKGSYLIVHSWLLGYDTNKQYYNRFINSSKKAKLQALHIAEENLFAKEIINEKCLDILFEFINQIDDDFASSYSTLILRKFNNSNFEELLPFMKKYSKTILFRNQPRYFLQYLLQCAKDYPNECLELLKNMKFNKVITVQDRGHYDAEPVQLVLSIYSSLNNNFNANKKQIEKALTVFDDMLKIDHLRLNSNKVMDTLKTI